jgi:hypothetical protein
MNRAKCVLLGGALTLGLAVIPHVGLGQTWHALPDSSTGCKYFRFLNEAELPENWTLVRWTGGCVNGHMQGEGVLFEDAPPMRAVIKLVIDAGWIKERIRGVRRSGDKYILVDGQEVRELTASEVPGWASFVLDNPGSGLSQQHLVAAKGCPSLLEVRNEAGDRISFDVNGYIQSKGGLASAIAEVEKRKAAAGPSLQSTYEALLKAPTCRQ